MILGSHNQLYQTVLEHPQILRCNSCSHGGWRIHGRGVGVKNSSTPYILAESWLLAQNPQNGFRVRDSFPSLVEIGTVAQNIEKNSCGAKCDMTHVEESSKHNTLNSRDIYWTSFCFIKCHIMQHVCSGRNYFKLYPELIISLPLGSAHTIRLVWILEAVKLRKFLAVERIMYCIHVGYKSR